MPKGYPKNGIGGRFKKGIKPWNKGTKGVMKGWNKGIPFSAETRLKMSLSSKGKKLSETTKKKIAKKMKNNKYALGKHWKLSKATKLKMSLSKKGKKLSQEHLTKLKLRVMTTEHKANISKNHHNVSGKNNPMYGKRHKDSTRKKISIANGSKKGWITPFTKSLRKCFKYRQWRSDIFTRDNWTCIICFVKGTYLEADHYPKMFSSILQEYNIKDMETADACEELWDINNGRTLCKECHNKTKLGKPKK